MAALSTKDKLMLKLSRERVERWDRERLKPAKNPVPNEAGEIKPIRCRSIWWGGTERPDEVIQPDKLDAINRATDGIRMRTVASKLGDARLGAARRGLEHSQGHGDSVQAICHDPSRDYVGPVLRDESTIRKEHAAMVQHERNNMPARVRRKLGV